MGKKNKKVPDGAFSSHSGAQKKAPSLPDLETQKKPILSSINTTEKVAWRFSRMDCGGKGKCSLRLLHDYDKKLTSYENFTRKEVEAKDHCHPCNPGKLSKIGKERIKALRLDVATLYQLDLGTPCRLWGVWDGSVFNVIWLDQAHDFYDSKAHK